VSCAVRSHYNLFRRVSNRAMSAVYSVTNFHMSLQTLENGDVTKGSLSKAFFSLCANKQYDHVCVLQNGFTPLMNAAYFNHFSMVQLLLENGADTNAVNSVR